MNHYYWIFLLPVAALMVIAVIAFLNYLSLSGKDGAEDGAAGVAAGAHARRKIYTAGAVVGLVAALGFMFREPLGRLAGTDSPPGTSAMPGPAVQRITAYPGQWSIPFNPPQGFAGMIVANVPDGTNPRCKMRLIYRDQTVREFDSTALAREHLGDVASIQYMSLETYPIEFVVMPFPWK